MNNDKEVEKWDSYYELTPLFSEEDEFTRIFGVELEQTIARLLPEGGRILEAGSGGGWQSLALARTGKYEINLLDFSKQALNYSQQIFEANHLTANFFQEDMSVPGAPEFDLVFNSGVLEHYTVEQQAALLRGMASRSRKYVLVLIPNRLAYWYWVWRIQKVKNDDWAFGKEVPSVDLSEAFAQAGLHLVGHRFLGRDWSTSFLQGLEGLDEALRKQLISIHLSPLVEASQKAYLIAALGVVDPALAPASVDWNMHNVRESGSFAELYAALADALALQIQADHRTGLAQRAAAEAQKQSEQQILALEAGAAKLNQDLSQSQSVIQQQDTQLAEHHQQINLLKSDLDQLQTRLKTLEADFSESQARILQQETSLADKTYQITQGQNEIKQAQTKIYQLQDLLDEIESSNGWKMVRAAWKLKMSWFPTGSRRSRFLSRFNRFYKKLVTKKPAVVPVPVQQPAKETSSEARLLAPAKYDVIIFPVIDWDFRFQRPQQIASQFLQHGHRVFYIKTRFVKAEQPVIQEIRPNLYEVSLPGFVLMNIYQDSMAPYHIEKAMRGLSHLFQTFQIGHALTLVDLPFWTPLALRARERFGWKIIYDCMDEHSGFSNNREEMLQREEELVRSSDLVLVSATRLLEKNSVLNPKCLLLPNACDFSHFSKPAGPIPADLSGIKHPIIGYYGAISDWFDTTLVGDLARANPDWQFVLIGNTAGANLEPFANQRNIHLLGEKPYTTLPQYLACFDVCLIPFLKTPLTDATNPVKLFEYLSAGKPIVASRLDEIEKYASQVALADSPNVETWTRLIQAALQNQDPAAVKQRVDFARQNTWDKRFDDLNTAIVQLYPKASIIILTYNNFNYNRMCLESIIERTDYPNYEVIVVDNASTDPTPQYLKEFSARYPVVKIHLSAINTGFAGGNNLGLQDAEGERLVLLNNDTVVTRGWLSRLVTHLEDASIGMVGPATNFSGNESRIEVDYADISSMPAFAFEFTSAHLGMIFDTRMIAFFCAAFRRDVLDKVGELDTRYGIGMFEDDDFCLRVRQAGYRVVIVDDCFVHHWGRASFSKLEEARYQAIFDENRQKFEDKWGIRWEPHVGRG